MGKIVLTGFSQSKGPEQQCVWTESFDKLLGRKVRSSGTRCSGLVADTGGHSVSIC